MALAVVSVTGGWLFGAPMLWRIAALLGLLVVLCGLYSWLCLRGLVCERRQQLAPPVTGDQLHERLTLTNTAIWPVLWVQIGATGDLPGYKLDHVLAMGPGSSATWTHVTQCTRRGRYDLGGLIAQAGDPFGLFMVSRWLGNAASVVVRPRPLRVQTPSLVSPGSPTLSAPLSSRGGERTALLRPAGATDRPAHIAWVSSLRTGVLLARQEEGAAQAGVRLVVDLAGSWGHDEEIERLTGAAAYLAFELLRAGHAVGLICGGGQLMQVPAASGPAHGRRLWDVLALAPAGQNIGLPQLLALPARGLGVTVVSAAPGASDLISRPWALYPGYRGVAGWAPVLVVPPPPNAADREPPPRDTGRIVR